MKEIDSLSAQQVGQLIQEYLRQYPEIGGLRGLAEKAGMSYDSVQKYAKGSNLPPRAKLDHLLAAISSPPSRASIRSGLFGPQSESESPLMKEQQAESQLTSLEKEEAVVSFPADLIEDEKEWSHLQDRQEFFTPVHNFVWFYPEEVKIIDHPAFQRLAGMHQLGMTNLVYRGATHRRIEHALGAVGVAQRILEAVSHNGMKHDKDDPKDEWLLGHPPTKYERRFIRLGALLHDIGHVPYGHTIEDELHLLNKHDEDERLDRIFKKTTWYSKEVETLADLINEQYNHFMPLSLAGRYKPAELLRLIITKKKSGQEELERQFAEAGLRISVCRDIVGDTICADLLDYLHRDWYHIGKPRYFDERILQYMEIRTPRDNGSIAVNDFPRPTAHDVFVISIGNRPRLRSDGVSAILNLLESRYELAEAVLFHRTKMAATAMLERALGLAIPPPSESATDLEGWMLDNPEEVLLPALLQGRGPVEVDKLTPQGKKNWEHACALVSRLLRRDLYDLLLMVTYDEFEVRDADSNQRRYGDEEEAPKRRAEALRLMENDFGLPPGSLVMYCPESRMNSKIAKVQIFVENNVGPFEKYEREHNNMLSAGHLSAQLDRFKRLWKIGFFIDPEVRKEKGGEFLTQLREAIRILILNKYPRGESVEMLTAQIARSVVGIKSFHRYGREAHQSPKVLKAAKSDETAAVETYPTKARTLLSFIGNDKSGSNP